MLGFLAAEGFHVFFILVVYGAHFGPQRAFISTHFGRVWRETPAEELVEGVVRVIQAGPGDPTRGHVFWPPNRPWGVFGVKLGGVDGGSHEESDHRAQMS